MGRQQLAVGVNPQNNESKTKAPPERQHIASSLRGYSKIGLADLCFQIVLKTECRLRRMIQRKHRWLNQLLQLHRLRQRVP